MQLKQRSSRGDTIIEVLIALTIAGLAIGMSYSIAYKSIQKVVSARERDTAVGLLESQVNALKLRQELSDPSTNDFVNNFASKNNFCLDDQATDPQLPSWQIKQNGSSAATILQAQPSGPYEATTCVQNIQNNFYYLNITTVSDSGSSNQTDFRLDVRWPHLGGGANNDATFYYRF